MNFLSGRGAEELTVYGCSLKDPQHLQWKGSEKQTLRLFNQFEEYANNIEESVDKERKIMMYCTGGIRCELFSAKLKERGFQDVNQLEVGVLFLPLFSSLLLSLSLFFYLSLVLHISFPLSSISISLSFL